MARAIERFTRLLLLADRVGLEPRHRTQLREAIAYVELGMPPPWKRASVRKAIARLRARLYSVDPIDGRRMLMWYTPRSHEVDPTILSSCTTAVYCTHKDVMRSLARRQS